MIIERAREEVDRVLKGLGLSEADMGWTMPAAPKIEQITPWPVVMDAVEKVTTERLVATCNLNTALQTAEDVAGRRHQLLSYIEANPQLLAQATPEEVAKIGLLNR